jgi:hypothetical protein
MRAGMLLLAATLAAQPASAILITFDSLPAMPNNPGLAVPLASQLSNQLLATTGAVFSSAAGYVAVTDLVALGESQAISKPNGIGGANAAGQLSYGTPITVAFFDPSNPLVPAVYDFVQIRGDELPLPPGSISRATLEAFDLLGSSLGSVTANDVSGGLTLTFSAPGIHSIQLRQSSAAFGFDGTIGFDNLVLGDGPLVPEARAWALLCAGLVAMGARRVQRPRAGAGHTQRTVRTGSANRTSEPSENTAKRTGITLRVA